MEKISLNGKWLYCEDSEQKLTYSDIAVLIASNKLKKEMSIPLNWQLAGLNNFNGSVWFVKNIKQIDKAQTNNISVLKFYGVDYFTDVWVNGVKAGSHEGYFQPFSFDVTKLLKNNSDNLIVVKVTSPKEIPGKVWPLKKQLIKGIFNHHDCRPGAWSYEFGQDKNTGGIWNDVCLFTGSKVIVDTIKIKPLIINNGNTARILITAKHFNIFEVELQSKLKININFGSRKIINKNIEVKLAPLAGEFSFTIDIDKPKLWYSWDIGEQNIYTLVLRSEYFTDVEEKFGVREVKLDENKNFFINGKKLFLRGTNIIPAQFLSEFSVDKIKELIALMREANINAVRVHAHVNRKELYHEFDKAGIIVWQDFALQWTYEDSEAFVTNAVRQIKDMTLMLHNHPSIAFWCCHNEPGDQIKNVDPFLYDAVLSEDNTRIIRLASNYEEHPYDGWYWGDTKHYAAAPMGPLVTEFGAQALPELASLRKFLSAKAVNKYDWKEWEYHDFQYDQTFNIAKISKGKNISEFVNNSQKYQADVIKTATDFYRRKKNDGITGVFQFMFIDCWESITWSVVDYYREKKTGFYALKNAFAPVYLSVNLRQDTYLTGSKLNVDFNLINDLYKEYKNCSIVFKWGKVTLGEITNIVLTENCNRFIHWESVNVPFPAVMAKGEYEINISLLDKINKVVLSEQKIKISLVEKI